MTPACRTLSAAFARTRRLTATPALITWALGLVATVGWRRAIVVGAIAIGLQAVAPALLALVRDAPRLTRRPFTRIVAWITTMDVPSGLAWVWVAGAVVADAGWLASARWLAVGGAVFIVPRVIAAAAVVRVSAARHPLPATIAVQRSDAMGDFVMSTAVARALHAAAPDAEVTWVCRPAYAELLTRHPYVRRVVADPTVAGSGVRDGLRRGGWRNLSLALRALRPGALVLLWDRWTPVYHAAAWLAGVRVRCGDLLGHGFGWMCTAGTPLRDDPLQHEVERNLAMVEALGVRPADPPRLWVGHSPEAADCAGRLLAQHGIPPGQPFVALSPATSGTNRRLDVGTYAAAIQHIHDQYGTPTVLLGAGDDRHLCAEILGASPPGTVDLAGQTSAGTLAAVIACSRMHVGCDSGPAHVAAALQVPSVVISPAKAQKPLRWGPWMSPHRIVRARAHCLRACHPPSCPADDCVRAIRVSDLCAVIDAVWEGHTIVEPVAGRRSWAAVSLSPIVHSSCAVLDERALDAMRRLRAEGFIEFALACRQGSPTATAAAGEGFDVRPNTLGCLVDVLVEFDGGPVYDLDACPRRTVRLALSLARPRCSPGAARYLAAPADGVAARSMVDFLLRGARHWSGQP